MHLLELAAASSNVSFSYKTLSAISSRRERQSGILMIVHWILRSFGCLTPILIKWTIS